MDDAGRKATLLYISPPSFSVPEGRLKIAQRFIAGWTSASYFSVRPGGTVENCDVCRVSIVPTGQADWFGSLRPSDESLGYYQMPLRGKRMSAHCDLRIARAEGAINTAFAMTGACQCLLRDLAPRYSLAVPASESATRRSTSRAHGSEKGAPCFRRHVFPGVDQSQSVVLGQLLRHRRAWRRNHSWLNPSWRLIVTLGAPFDYSPVEECEKRRDHDSPSPLPSPAAKGDNGPSATTTGSAWWPFSLASGSIMMIFGQ